jgi:aminopeptidase
MLEPTMAKSATLKTKSAPAKVAPDAHHAKLDALAEVAVKVGLGLAPGQPVVMTAPIEGADLARLVAKHAYKAGASLVTTIYDDDQLALARYQHAKPASFDHAAGWLYEGMAQAYAQGAARLAIRGGNPNLLAGQDPDKIARANRALSTAYQPALEKITGFDINWTLLPYASAAWATTVFPKARSEAQAVAKLWDAIFMATRCDAADPIANWKAHNKTLAKRTKYLNGKSYAALHFRGPGTDLTVGLADDHEWCGGAATAKNGITCNANIPTEEVFTTPHKDRVEGVVRATKPLSYMGTLIEDIAVRFEGGRIVEAKARTGENVLKKVLETDEGARRLGEVALVPFSSPISASGLLFYNTLFDENAACHIALGQAYAKCFKGGTQMSETELARRGANRSLIHIDWMIGSDQVDIDGITATGKAEPLMRRGEWA